MCEGDVVSGSTLIDVKAYGWRSGSPAIPNDTSWCVETASCLWQDVFFFVFCFCFAASVSSVTSAWWHEGSTATPHDIKNLNLLKLGCLRISVLLNRSIPFKKIVSMNPFSLFHRMDTCIWFFYYSPLLFFWLMPSQPRHRYLHVLFKK